jgi:hypothetical protein
MGERILRNTGALSFGFHSVIISNLKPYTLLYHIET